MPIPLSNSEDGFRRAAREERDELQVALQIKSYERASTRLRVYDECRDGIEHELKKIATREMHAAAELRQETERLRAELETTRADNAVAQGGLRWLLNLHKHDTNAYLNYRAAFSHMLENRSDLPAATVAAVNQMINTLDDIYWAQSPQPEPA